MSSGFEPLCPFQPQPFQDYGIHMQLKPCTMGKSKAPENIFLPEVYQQCPGLTANPRDIVPAKLTIPSYHFHMLKRNISVLKYLQMSAQLLYNFIDYNWLLLLQPKNFTQNSNYTIQHETARDTDPLTSLGKNQRAKSKTGSHQVYSLCSQPRLINAFNGSLPLSVP